MKILGVSLQFLPTNKNYSMSVFSVGVSRRTLKGTADVHARAIKRRWTITIPEQGLTADLTPYLDGTPFSFEDIDGTVYSVVLMGSIPVSGYPAVAEVVLSLEEA